MQNSFFAKLSLCTVLVFCFSVFLAANASAAMYYTYADLSNTEILYTSRVREVTQIFKMPIRGRINSIQLKAGGFDGGGTSTLRPGVCRVTDNSVGASCVGAYVWANESPWIIPQMKWYTYTFPSPVFDKDAYLIFYFKKSGPALYEQAYAAAYPSSTYPHGLSWLNRPNAEISSDIQILIDISPCNNNFSGHVYNQTSGEKIAGAGVRMILNNFVATAASCANFYSDYSFGAGAYCVPGDSAGLELTTDSLGYFNFAWPKAIGGNFTVQVFADNFATSTSSYNEIYSDNGDCVNSVQRDFYIKPIEKRTPIVIVPGILGSYLYNLAGEEVWLDAISTISDPWDFQLNQLALSSNGEPSGSEVMVPNDILRNLYGKDFFQGLIEELNKSGYKEGKDIFVFPYDWRLDINKSSKDLKNKIEEIKAQTGSGKVNIVAHSMGGLVAKQYVNLYGQNSVDEFIDIATPHLGSSKAFKILTYGDDLGANFVINQDRIYQISQNMPAIYQLLPSRKYFDSADADYESYIADIYDVDQNNVKGKLNYDQSMELMKNMGRNGYLLAKNNELHNAIDDFDPLAYGIKAYNIVGCGQPTIGETYILNKESSGYEYGLKYISGDATVPLKSAEYLKNSQNIYYITGAEHSLLPSFSGVKELVVAIVNNQAADFNYSVYPNIRQNHDACPLNGWQVSFHSPIELNIYDENNNHLGPNRYGDIEMGIEGASYDIVDGNKFAFLPKGHSYRIAGQATGSGSFNARIQDIQNSQTVETQYFNSVPLYSTSASVEYYLNDETKNADIKIDQDGDHLFETSTVPSAVLNQTESQDITKPQTTAAVNGDLGQNNWYKSDVSIVLAGQDDDSGSGILKIEHSIDGGQIWQTYIGPVVLTGNGRHEIHYRATDKAGNVEEAKSLAMNIDLTGPVIDIFSPPNEARYLHSDNISPVYEVSDVYSGVATDSIQVIIDQQEISSTTINLFDYSPGTHIITVSAQDLAGNSSSVAVVFSIGVDIGSTTFDVGVLFNRGWINEKVYRQLTNDLEMIKKQIEKYGQKKIAVDTRFAGAMSRCIAKKGIDWCSIKLKPRLDKIEYTLNKIYQKIIALQYQLIIAELNQYNKKSWIDSQAYKMLKEDISYLINELS